MYSHKEEQNTSLEKDVSDLQKQMIGVQHILQNQERMLSEIKDVMVIQTETLQEFIRMKDKHEVLREDYEMSEKRINKRINDLEDDYAERKKETNDKIGIFERFKAKTEGGLAVLVMFFGVFIYYINSVDTKVEKIEHRLHTHIDDIQKKQAPEQYVPPPYVSRNDKN